MRIEDIKNVTIIGAGHMGQQIGLACAIGGYDVTLYDVAESPLAEAQTKIKRLARHLAKKGNLSAPHADAALLRISSTTDLATAAEKADFISESVPEDPSLKGKIFGQFNALCPARTIFTTNTSTLLPSIFAEATGRPDRFAAFHFHDIRMTEIVDIMPHPGTSQATIDLIQAFAKRIGQNAIVLSKENHGYVFNALVTEWFRAAQSLAARGVATPEDVDRAWMGVMHALIGPFGAMDSVGLDTVWHITDYWAKKTENRQSAANAAFLKAYVDKGWLGQKSGRGFYTYPDATFLQPDFLKGQKE